jgi:hypothetical protein
LTSVALNLHRSGINSVAKHPADTLPAGRPHQVPQRHRPSVCVCASVWGCTQCMALALMSRVCGARCQLSSPRIASSRQVAAPFLCRSIGTAGCVTLAPSGPACCTYMVPAQAVRAACLGYWKSCQLAVLLSSGLHFAPRVAPSNTVPLVVVATHPQMR